MASQRTNKEAVELVQSAWTRASKTQTDRNNAHIRLWQRYKSFNPNITDPYRSNIIYPKLYSIIETIVPRLGKALFGRRPYIPIKNEKAPDQAEAIEQALDSYLYRDKAKITFIKALKLLGVFGTAFIEPYPAREIVTEKKMVQSQVYPWGQEMAKEQIPRFRLKNRLWAPWQVYPESKMTDLDSDGEVVLVETVSRKSVEKLQASGRYNKFDLSRADSGEAAEKDFVNTMLSSLNIDTAEQDDKHGILMRYMSNDRYITLWNGIDVLEDRKNPFEHGKINLVRIVCNEDPMIQNSFWGQAEGKNIEPILDKLDETWNTTFDNHDLINQQMIAFHENAVDAEDIVAVGGIRIKIKGIWQRSIDDAIKKIDIAGLPSDFYNIASVLSDFVDESAGSYPPMRGDISEDKTTATEISLASSHGDLRNELRTEIIEGLGLSRLADLSCSHIDQFATLDDLYDEIGDPALEMMTANPNQLPGGADYQFRGSDTFVNDFQKQADWRKVIEAHNSDPAARPGAMLRETLRRHGLSDKEIDEKVYTEEELMQMQAMAMQQEERNAAMQAANRGGGNSGGPAQVPTVANPAG